MFSRKVRLLFVFFLIYSVPFFAAAQATTSSNAELQTLITQLQAQIQSLQTQIEDLKVQLRSVKIELKFGRVLAKGATGDDVKQLQEFLSIFPSVYPDGLVTGYFGPRTEAAVRKFQEQNGIESVGIVGPKTQAKLNELVTTGAEQLSVLPPGPTSAASTSSTPSGTIPATPAIPAISSASATSTVPATPATSAIPGGNLPPPSAPSPSPTPTPSPSPSPSPTPSPTPTATSTPPAPPPPPPQSSSITVTYPNGGETLERYNYAIRYDFSGVSKVGYKLLKGSQIVYDTASPTNVDASQLSFDPYSILAQSQTGSDFTIRVYDWEHPTLYDDSNSSFTILIDKTPPVVSSATASAITENSALITWTTDEPARGFVNYGSAPGTFVVTPTNTTYSTSHSFILTGLTSGTLYTFRVYSTDASGNGPEGYPPDHTFTTTAAAPSPTASTTSLDLRTSNLAAIYYILESLKAIVEKLAKLLQ